MLPRVGSHGGGRENLYSSSPSRRKSMHSDHRRHSSVPQPALVKQDPRPMTDKGYQNTCVKQLMDYLVKSDYPYHITHKTLSRPSGKDFCNIVTFLLRRIDPSFQNGTMKLEDEVAMNFKAMGYPYPISKTALVAAGSPHTWPALLAALTWLMETLKCVEEINRDEDADDGKFESAEELAEKTESKFFKYLQQAYSAFLRSDQETSDSLTDNLVDMFERDNQIIENEVERVTELNADVVEMISRLGEEGQSLPTMSQKREDYATDLEQFHDLVRQMDEHKDALAKKVEERTAELEKTNEALKDLATRTLTLKEQVQTQELSVEDVRKIKSEQARLKEALEKARALKGYNKEELWKSNSELSQMFEELEGHVHEYYDLTAELSRIVDTNGINLKMAVDKSKAITGDQGLLLGVDHHGEVQNFLNEMQDGNIELLATTRRELQSTLDELERSKESYTEALDHSKIIEGKRSKCEETLEAEKEQQDATLAVREGEVCAIEEKIESLRDPAALEEQMIRYQRQLDQLEALNRKHQEENLLMKQAVQKEINAAIQAIIAHNVDVKKKFADLKAYASEKEARLTLIRK